MQRVELPATRSYDRPADWRDMTDPTRTIDPTRQGIINLAEQDAGTISAEPVTVEQALASVAGWQDRGMPLFGLHQVAIALAGEVERLQEINGAMASLLRTQGCRNLELVDELARLRAALPEVVGCHDGDFAKCHYKSWPQCCPLRKRLVKADIISPPEAQAQEGGE